MKVQSHLLQYLAIAIVFALGLWAGPRIGMLLSGGKMAKDAQKRVEQAVTELSYVCFENACDNGMGVMEDFSIADKKKYFTDAGWKDYQSYIGEQQQALKSRKQLPNEKEGIRIKDGTQHYASEDGGTLKLTAVGDVWHGSGDQQFFRGEKADLDISLSQDQAAPNGIAISGWRVAITPVP